MYKNRKSLMAVIASGALLVGVGLAASPALAATATGVNSCKAPRVVNVVTNSSKAGSGTIINVSTSGGTSYNFPGGSYSKPAYPHTSWTVNNGSGYFYSGPYGTCI